jgi:glycosyltransferase involved in cell wall biosynthesis
LGKPVVVTDGPGARDYVADGKTGLIVPPSDGSALAEALRWVLDPSHRRDVEATAERGREAVRERFSPARYARALLDVALGGRELAG